MSESSTQHADAGWPHPASEAARLDGRYSPDRTGAPARLTDDAGIHRD
ncbi:hypothetical protein Ae168Ps1_4442 [Pseudonocardia sp. Ae168_Ps1]|nr:MULTISPECIES: hypothetical protein [unclassified Pseudonocardia]OLL76037.1 hypothetical protein Ae150APs1_4415 [Pseudonocardia sp. Ae150A_Ps1]OLL82036.1 hypothetical protein Ae168Ps1_4442 [Pseudonocardia sp. Ae168_Ps1]OLL83851.1 hypothetical protein Ae263Ps1_0906c [Pseudonocardia sp. Ae263_Ps1]OLL90108.1 hypothetical protein Ae356Ps1_0005 [Pseudonocardia sp. Ae356_Ps1]